MSFPLNKDFGDNFGTGTESVKGLGAFVNSELNSRCHVDCIRQSERVKRISYHFVCSDL